MKFFNIDESEYGLRLDQVIAQRYPELSRSYWSQVIKDGHVHVNDVNVPGKYRLSAGDAVTILNAETLESQESHSSLVAQNIPLCFVEDQEHFCVINKPAGLVVHPGAGVKDGTLANGLIAIYPQCADLPNWGLIHRLDKDTTGLMVVAKTLEGYHSLNSQMLERKIHRQYRAIVMGQVRRDMTIQSYLSRDPVNRLKKRSSPHSEHGKIAITHIKILQRYETITDLLCILDTGRTHQIRVHLESIGHPLVGEQLYSRHAGARRLFPRQALHAEQLSFMQPCAAQEHWLEFHACLPDDIKNLLDSFEPQKQTAAQLKDRFY